MAHKFDGPWTVFQTIGNAAPTVDPNKLEVFIRADGTVDETRSHHGQLRLTGNATELALNLQRHETGNTRFFGGRIAEDCIINLNRRVQVIVGTFVDRAVEVDPNVRPNTQNEGVWVITKP